MVPVNLKPDEIKAVTEYIKGLQKVSIGSNESRVWQEAKGGQEVVDVRQSRAGNQMVPVNPKSD